MPYDLVGLRIKWEYQKLSSTQQPVARKWAARLALCPGNHGVESFSKLLADASSELGSSLTGYARGADDGKPFLATAVDGVSRLEECDEAKAELLVKAMDAQDVPLDMSDFEAAGCAQVEQALYWPKSMLLEIRKQAARLDVSLSHAVQRAWAHARKDLLAAAESTKSRAASARSKEESHLASGDKVKQTLVLPFDMWREMTQLAERLDRSKSWVAQQAWLAARGEMSREKTASK